MAEITVELGDDEALVLFELLHRWETDGKLQVIDPSERHALERLQGAFERTLVAPLRSDYDAHLEAARASVMARWGAG
jgi:hypothetical protein